MLPTRRLASALVHSFPSKCREANVTTYEKSRRSGKLNSLRKAPSMRSLDSYEESDVGEGNLRSMRKRLRGVVGAWSVSWSLKTPVTSRCKRIILSIQYLSHSNISVYTTERKLRSYNAFNFDVHETNPKGYLPPQHNLCIVNTTKGACAIQGADATGPTATSDALCVFYMSERGDEQKSG